METTAPNLSEHPWMEHEETGHRAQLPDIGYWRGNGWHPCDGPPPEPVLTRDTVEPEPETEDETPAPEEPGSSAAKPKKATKSTAKTDEEEE
jgi:hypothetical protein